MRRSVPLHYTDYGYGLHEVKLAFQDTLFRWIPYFKDFALSWDNIPDGRDWQFEFANDAFAYHCALAAMLFVALDIRDERHDHHQTRQMVSLWRRAADLVLRGDYYPLLPGDRSVRGWVLRQFDLPEEGRGFVQAIRHRDCPEPEKTIALRTIAPDAQYRLDDPETRRSFQISGEDLLHLGITFSLPPRGAAIWFYERVE